jgi:carboxylesterase
MNLNNIVIQGVIYSMALFIVACSSTPTTIETWWMDSPATLDASLTEGSLLRVSNWPTPSVTEKGSRKVILAVHGYSASTYEWGEFREYAHNKIGTENIAVSMVLLGGHGRNQSEFRSSTWEEWGQPILDEYQKLKALGYTDISMVGASTGGTLILKYLSQQSLIDLDHIFFIDTLVIPRNKLMYLVPIMKPVIGDEVSDSDSREEEEYWYKIRPKETISELTSLINVVKGELESIISVPHGTTVTLFQSKNDPTVHPISAYLIWKGIQPVIPDNKVHIIESDLHVFTRLNGRIDSVKNNQHNIDNQKRVFDQILEQVK